MRRSPRDLVPGLLLGADVLSQLVFAIVLIYVAWCEWTPGEPSLPIAAVITSWMTATLLDKCPADQHEDELSQINAVYMN